MKEVFPKEILDQSAHLYFFRFSRTGRMIYGLMIIALAGTIASLPFIKIDVYHTSRGIIKPAKERQMLTALNSGKVLFSRLHYNSAVTKGDTLLIIDNNGLDEELAACRAKLLEVSNQIYDLSNILGTNQREGHFAFRSAKYRSAFAEFRLKLNEFETRITQRNKDYSRKWQLFDRGVISRSEFEQLSMDHRLGLSEKLLFKQGQWAVWHKELVMHEESRHALMAKEEQLEKTISQHILTAAMNGNLMNVKTQSEASLVVAGTNLAEISPDTLLVAECYVPPGDIGLVRESIQASFKIDTYDYNQWGIVKGTILDIGRDMEIIDGIPFFKVRCLLERDFLELRNGFRGKILKGMTLTAQFPIAHRTLWQLLYDKTDDWLNPGQMKRSI